MSGDTSALTGIYTLTALHCGIGRAVSAVDLPIAREAHTELPLIPSTSLKGVARDALKPGKDAVQATGRLNQKRWIELFGSEPPGRKKKEDEEREGADEEPKDASGGRTTPGLIVFTDARLLLMPARCLQRPFVYLTSPLLLDRLARDLEAFGLKNVLDLDPEAWRSVDDEGALVSDGALAREPALIIEDRVYPRENIRHEGRLKALANTLLALVPEGEAVARQRLPGNLVVISDRELKAICKEAAPIVARTQLTDGKTTDKWEDPETGDIQGGNLWYQEQLPSDCLFYSVMTTRRDARALRDALGSAGALRRVQIGGGETVGMGQCWWQVAGQGGAA